MTISNCVWESDGSEGVACIAKQTIAGRNAKWCVSSLKGDSWTFVNDQDIIHVVDRPERRKNIFILKDLNHRLSL